MAIQAWHIMREKISVGKDTTVKEAAHKIISSGLPGMPVVDDTMEVIGMVTEHGILGAIREGLDLDKIPASKIMAKTPATAESNASPDDLIRMMIANYACAVIPIVKNKKYVGVVSRHMLMDAHLSPYFVNFSSKDGKGPFFCM
jgi:predicted transcriptional regulator